MDIQRAKQIIISPDLIRVTYQGTPVWIEKVQQASALVSAAEFTDGIKNIPLDQLIEEE